MENLAFGKKPLPDKREKTVEALLKTRAFLYVCVSHIRRNSAILSLSQLCRPGRMSSAKLLRKRSKMKLHGWAKDFRTRWIPEQMVHAFRPLYELYKASSPCVLYLRAEVTSVAVFHDDAEMVLHLLTGSRTNECNRQHGQL